MNILFYLNVSGGARVIMMAVGEEGEAAGRAGKVQGMDNNYIDIVR